MPRLPKSKLNTNFIHVVTQGINREFIFNTQQQRCEYKKLMKKYKDEYHIQIIAYCIMGNHVHILVYVKDIKNLTKYMHRINTIYAIFYNKRNQRVGYVFRDRYKTQGIYYQKHLINCVSYIHNNPVVANICKNPENYEFSSYNEYINNPKLINPKYFNKYIADIKDFLKIHKSKNYIRYLDIEDKKQVAILLLNSFLKDNNINKQQLIENKKLLNKIIKILINNQISIRLISEILGISNGETKKIINGLRR